MRNIKEIKQNSWRLYILLQSRKLIDYQEKACTTETNFVTCRWNNTLVITIKMTVIVMMNFQYLNLTINLTLVWRLSLMIWRQEDRLLSSQKKILSHAIFGLFSKTNHSIFFPYRSSYFNGFAWPKEEMILEDISI